MIALTINGQTQNIEVDPDTPLLWALREQVGLTGTKYGCGIAQCGACTVHVDGAATRSCMLPVSAAVGKQITTIEGLAQNGELPRYFSAKSSRLPWGSATDLTVRISGRQTCPTTTFGSTQAIDPRADFLESNLVNRPPLC